MIDVAPDPNATSPDIASPARPLAMLLWMLATLVAGLLCAVLFGSTTPRVRLIGLYPLALGAFVAFGATSLRGWFRLRASKLSFGWILLLSILVTGGSTLQAYRLWRDDQLGDYAEARARLQQVLQAAPPEERDRVLGDHFREAHQRTTFSYYLSRRLDSFARMTGRREAWDPPLPEVIFGAELCFAMVGGLMLLLSATRSRPENPQVTPAEQEPAL